MHFRYREVSTASRHTTSRRVQVRSLLSGLGVPATSNRASGELTPRHRPTPPPPQRALMASHDGADGSSSLYLRRIRKEVLRLKDPATLDDAQQHLGRIARTPGATRAQTATLLVSAHLRLSSASPDLTVADFSERPASPVEWRGLISASPLQSSGARGPLGAGAGTARPACRAVPPPNGRPDGVREVSAWRPQFADALGSSPPPQVVEHACTRDKATRLRVMAVLECLCLWVLPRCPTNSEQALQRCAATPTGPQKHR